jgi:hypothetical protein
VLKHLSLFVEHHTIIVSDHRGSNS